MIRVSIGDISDSMIFWLDQQLTAIVPDDSPNIDDSITNLAREQLQDFCDSSELFDDYCINRCVNHITFYWTHVVHLRKLRSNIIIRFIK
jgi:hypothetical protein